MEYLSWPLRWIKKNPLLLIIILSGLFIRLAITKPGFYSHGDELMYGQGLYMFLHRTLSMQVQWFGYPPLVGWIMLFFFTVFFIPLAWIIYFFNHFNELVLVLGGVSKNTFSGMVGFNRIFYNDILGHQSINVLYWGRYLTAIFGAGVIVLTYYVTLSLFKRKLAAMLSAIFVAFNYRLILSSHIGFIDMYNVFFLLLAILAISKLAEKPTLKNYLISWVIVSISFLTKYQVYALFPLAVVHIYLSLREPKLNLKVFLRNLLFNKKMLIGGIVALAIVLISHTHYFIQWKRVLAIHEYEAAKYQAGVNMLTLFPAAYLYHIGVGAVLSLLSLGGIAIGVFNTKWRLGLFILLSTLPISIFLYMYYTGGGFFTRNMIASIPIFLILAAVFMGEIFRFFWGQGKGAFRVLGVAVFLGFLYFALNQHIRNDFQLYKYYSDKSTYTRMQEWIRTNVAPGVSVSLYSNDPVVFNKPDKIRNLLNHSHYLSYQELKELGDDYALIEMTDIQGANTWWMRQYGSMSLKFWNKPDDLLSQGYMALATRELLWAHTVKAFLTPWQAPGFNYFFAKLDKQFLGDRFKKVDFDFNTEMWVPLAYFSEDLQYLVIENAGREGSKALAIKNRGRVAGGTRFESPKFNIKPGYGYKVTGWIKNDIDLVRETRNAFLRLDFYPGEVKHELLSRPIVSFVSERVYGESDWRKVTIEGVAPMNASMAVIGFQADNPQGGFYLDKIEVAETLDPVKLEFDPVIINDEDLFLPNNRGIL